MSHSSASERIIAEQEERLRQWQEAHADQAAKDREAAELRRAWDGVAYWLTSDGDIADADTLTPAPPAKAVGAIARLNRLLSARGLLDKLAEPPCGVEGEDLQAWRLAVDILHAAADAPAAAEQLLARVCRLPCAPTVRNWLCQGFRIVVEGRWETGPLCVEMLPTRVVNARSSGCDTADSRTTEADAPPQGGGRPAVPAEGMSRQEAAERLERRRIQGERFTSMGVLAKQIGCSKSTIQKALQSTSELKKWSKREGAPRAQQANPLVAEGEAEQWRESDPADAAAEAELKKLIEDDPNERAFINEIGDASRPFQSWYVRLEKTRRKQVRHRWDSYVKEDRNFKVQFLAMNAEAQVMCFDDSGRGGRAYPRP